MNNQDRIWDFFQNEGVESFSPSRGRLEYLGRYIQPSMRVLNIGVGNGLFESLALKKEVEIWSLDPNSRAIERLKKEFGLGDRAKVGYSQDMPLQDAYFDMVIMSEVLEHLSVAELSETLEEVQRVLRLGGRFLGTVPARENLADSLVVCPQCGHSFHRWGHQQSFDCRSMQDILTARFFVTEVSEHFFIEWESAGWRRRAKGLLKQFLSWRDIGPYGTYRNIFFDCRKES